MIHTGEIEVPRSTIVRSRSQPIPAQTVVTEADEATEITPMPPMYPQATPVPMAPPMAPLPPRPQLSAIPRAPRKLGIVWLLAALVPAGGAIALGFVKPTIADPVHTVEADSVAQLLGTTLDGEARAALVRAEAIASSSMLRAGIQTDAQTLADMAKDKDVVLPHGAGESIEVFQQAPEGRKSLLKLPADAPAVPPPPPGTARLEQRGDRVIVVVDATVTPQSGNIGGEIELVSPIDLSAIQRRPYEQLTGVTLTGFAAAISLGGGTPVANGTPITAQVVTTTAKGPALAVAGMIATPHADRGMLSLLKGLRMACAGLATLFIVIFGVSLLRR